MRGNNSFSILVLAFVFAVSLVSLPALGAGILSGALSLNDPVDDAFMNGDYTLEAEAFGTTLTNISFYYHNGSSGFACDNLTTGTLFTCEWDTTSVSDGLYNMTVNDSTGGFLATSTDVTIDNNPPKDEVEDLPF